MTSIELMDDLEAGELSVEFEGLEPWDVLEWGLGRFGERLSLSTAFQDGDVALIDMAYRIDPDVRVFSIDTGRLPQETHDLIEQCIPHSFGASVSHHQRPARVGSSGPIARVHGVQPIDV